MDMVAFMTQPGTEDVGPSRRLYGVMQFLMTRAAAGDLPEPAPARGVVTIEDALDAVLQVAAVIDSATQAGLIPVEQGVHGAAMLMVIREYIKSLPPGIGRDGTDGVDADLSELVRELRRVGGEHGLQG
jgi:hypothetical protein